MLFLYQEKVGHVVKEEVLNIKSLFFIVDFK